MVATRTSANANAAAMTSLRRLRFLNCNSRFRYRAWRARVRAAFRAAAERPAAPFVRAAFRAAALALLDQAPDLSLVALEAEHAALGNRLERFGDCRDALDIWEKLGVEEPEKLPILDTAGFLATVRDRRA